MTAPRSMQGQTLAVNVVWNLVGQGLPLLVAVACIPLLIDRLGPDRFAVLTLSWLVIGYFSLFDLGLGRALTKAVAERLGGGQAEEVPALVRTGMLLMLALGLVGGAVAGVLSPWLVGSALNIAPGLEAEALRSLYLLAASIPLVVTTAGWRGFLEANQRFDLVGMLRLAMGVFSFVGPTLILPFSRDVSVVVGVLLAGRFLAWLVHLVLCLRLAPALRHGVGLALPAVTPLVRLGGWMTVSNVVGPLMVYLDRFLIGALLPIAAVTYYATPHELVTKILIIPNAVIGVMFPAFAATFARDPPHTAAIFGRSVKTVFLVLFPLALAIVTLAHDALAVWLGASFADQSAISLRWLAAGVFVNGVSQVPFALIQGIGRADLTARYHLIELPFYLAVAVVLIDRHGIAGAAMAWCLRAGLDAVLLLRATARLLPMCGRTVQGLGAALGGSLLVFAVAASLDGLVFRTVLLVAALLAYAWGALFLALDRQERDFLRHGAKGALKRLRLGAYAKSSM